ncbi:MAG TPA: diacylglycerol kinase family protein, partial [Limnochorda sp.]
TALPSRLTKGPGHASELAVEAAQEGYPLVVAVGGDGTANEVVNGLMQLSPERRPAFGQLSSGTGNDFARNVGLPRRVDQWVRMLREPRLRSLDLGRVNGRYFLNATGVGFDAEVAYLADRLPTVFTGTFNYLVSILVELVTYRSETMRIQVDGTRLEKQCFLVAVGNLPHVGGGIRICPGARADDGLFEVVVVEALPRLEVLRVLPKAFSGGHIGHPKVQVYSGRQVIIDSDAPLHLQADGEVFAGLPAHFEVHPAALQLLVPAASSSAPPLSLQDEAAPSLIRPASPDG